MSDRPDPCCEACGHILTPAGYPPVQCIECGAWYEIVLRRLPDAGRKYRCVSCAYVADSEARIVAHVAGHNRPLFMSERTPRGLP